jgi:hypothetical protein
MIDRVPFVKYDTDELMISLSLQKQLLNENQSGDMSVILPYVQKYIVGFENLDEDAPKKEKLISPRRKVTEGDISRWVNEANVYIELINELEHINFLKYIDDYSLVLRRKKINDKVLLSAKLLILAFCAISDGSVSVDVNVVEDILAKLYKLTYDYGDSFTNEIFSFVESYAKNDEPWACFIMHIKYYRSTESNSNELTYKMLSSAIRDKENPFAAIRMGICYQWGIGCDVSGRTAKFWYDCAESLDCAEAYRWLGQLFEIGTWDFDSDSNQAEYYYHKGRDNNIPSCYYRLGLKKINDVDEAGKIFLDGCRIGDEKSLSWLADSYFENFVETKKISHEALELCASCINNPEFRGNQAIRILSELDSNEITDDSDKKVDAAFDHLISGIKQKNADCHDLLGDLMIIEVLRRQKIIIKTHNNEDTKKILNECWSFIEEELKNSDDDLSRFVKAAINICRKEYESDRDKMWRRRVILYNYFADEHTQGSPFWNVLTNPVTDEEYSNFFSKENLPSHLSGFHNLTPYRFIIALHSCPIRPNSDLEKVQKIWRLFRILDYEWVDCEQLRKGHGICLTTGAAETSLDRVRRIANIFSELSNLISLPNKYSELVSRLKEMEKELETSLILGSVLENKIQKVLVEGMKIVEDLKKSHKFVRIAYYLAEEEKRYSDPQLDIALNNYRSSYVLGGRPDVAIKLATLFFVNNGRFREDAANESIIYSIKDALFKAIYMKEWKAVPLFIETALFGYSTGAASIEADFQAISNADEVIACLIQEEESKVDKEVLIAKIKIALTMAKIYMDEGLYSSSRSEQKWGISTLLDRTKAVFWLIVAQKVYLRVSETVKEDEILLSDKFWDVVNQQIQKFKEKGYVSAGVDSELKKRANAVKRRDNISLMCKMVESELKGLIDKLEFFLNIKLGERIADLAASTDETALLMKMAVKGTTDAVSLAEDLVIAREELQKLETNSTLAIGIVCCQEDYNTIYQSVNKAIKEHNLHIFKLGDLSADVPKVFIDFRDSSETNVKPPDD